jgi:hypothetical protein
MCSELTASSAGLGLRALSQTPNRLTFGETPSEESVTAIVRRFLKDTQPLDQHRNRVSAHAFEKSVDPKLFLDLPKLKEQM